MVKRLFEKRNEESLSELRDIVIKHPLTKHLDFDDFDVVMLFQYIINIEKCQGCKGLKECTQDTEGYKPKLVDDGYYLSVEFIPCAYKQKALDEASQHGNIESLYVSPQALDARLENFELLNEERTKALKAASKFATSYKLNSFQKGMYIHGDFRTGKTYLLSAIANKLATRNIPCLIVYFPELTRRLKSAIGEGTLEEHMQRLKTVPILMLDDIGSESMTPWIRDDILGPILQYRLASGFPVFFSSNYPLSLLSDHLSETKSGIDDKLKAMRIIERIMELTTEYKLKEKRYIKR